MVLVAGLLSSGCHDATGPKDAPGVTPEGVIVTARVSRRFFGPSDTLWATAVLRNPTSAPVTLRVVGDSAPLYPSPDVVGRWYGPGRFDAMLPPATVGDGYISGIDTLKDGPSHALSIAAGDSLTYAFPLARSDAELASGTYTFRAALYLVGSDGKLEPGVASNWVTATLIAP